MQGSDLVRDGRAPAGCIGVICQRGEGRAFWVEGAAWWDRRKHGELNGLKEMEAEGRAW